MERLIKNTHKVIEPTYSKDELEYRQKLMDRKFALAEKYGVILYSFNDNSEVGTIFKNKKEEHQYFCDKIDFCLLLDEGKDLPSDLIERLLIVKERREKLKKKK